MGAGKRGYLQQTQGEGGVENNTITLNKVPSFFLELVADCLRRLAAGHDKLTQKQLPAEAAPTDEVNGTL